MSPPTRRLPAATEIAPFETTSPMTFSVPLPLMLIEFPPVPPQPAPSRAATVGVYSRLFTSPWAVAQGGGLAPSVNPGRKGGGGVLLAGSGKRPPGGPTTRATERRGVV